MTEAFARAAIERAYFLLCSRLGRLFRSATYSTVRIVIENGVQQVRKQRASYAPVLMWSGGLLFRILDTGVRILPQRRWEERERRLYRRLYGTEIRIDPKGRLTLPCLAGRPLAELLHDSALQDSARKTAIKRAVTALAELHARGFTHGDAMCENVLVDLDAGVAHWVDFETVHDSTRAIAWRRADDLRAFVATCLVRTASERFAETLEHIVDAYPDEGIVRLLAGAFGSRLRRPLAFHLGQAPLSYRRYREIARLLEARMTEPRAVAGTTGWRSR